MRRWVDGPRPTGRGAVLVPAPQRPSAPALRCYPDHGRGEGGHERRARKEQWRKGAGRPTSRSGQLRSRPPEERVDARRRDDSTSDRCNNAHPVGPATVLGEADENHRVDDYCESDHRHHQPCRTGLPTCHHRVLPPTKSARDSQGQSGVEGMGRPGPKVPWIPGSKTYHDLVWGMIRRPGACRNDAESINRGLDNSLVPGSRPQPGPAPSAG